MIGSGYVSLVSGACFADIGHRRSPHINATRFWRPRSPSINEIANLCEKVSANVQDVARGIRLDNRIGSRFLHAGHDHGGSCLPKDPLARLKTSQDYDTSQRIVDAVVSVNDTRKRAIGRKVNAAMDGHVRGRTVADAAVIVTGWDALPAPDFTRTMSLLSSPILVALRNIYSEAYAAAGLHLCERRSLTCFLMPAVALVAAPRSRRLPD